MAALAIALSAPISGAAVSQPLADVVVLGEVHDNPTHHLEQARLISELRPTAVVFEMLTPVQAARAGPDTPRDERLGALLEWEASGWPDFTTYLPIFEAMPPGAAILGGGGDDVRDLSAFGLDVPLPPGQQAAREALQAAAHCDALPADVLPAFVARQRETDARLARATLDALAAHGPPVALIAGNGHARTDWGVPAAIARAAPDVSVHAVVQGEGGDVPPGDAVLTSAAPERGDPCAALR